MLIIKEIQIKIAMISKFLPRRLEKIKMQLSMAGTGPKWSATGEQCDDTDQTINQECLLRER